MRLAQVEKIGIEAALASTDFNLTEAARILGIGRTTLFNKVKAFGFRKSVLLGTKAPTEPASLADLERTAIENALASTDCNVSDAARILGISRTTLIRKVEALGLRKNVLLGRAAKRRSSKRTPAVMRKRKAKQLESGVCLSCGGAVQRVQGPGRRHSYRRRVDVAIPDDFSTDTCVDCGEIYMSDREISDLEQRIEQGVHEAMLAKKPVKRGRRLNP